MKHALAWCLMLAAVPLVVELGVVIMVETDGTGRWVADSLVDRIGSWQKQRMQSSASRLA